MLSEEKEDYLKAIYTLGGTEHYISNKQLAEQLNIRPPSVTEMVGRLTKEGFTESKAYRGTRLTSKGLDTALKLVKRHRLIECFLIQSLGYKWDEVHREAEVLEHRVSDLFIDRLDQLLDYPEYCPHGSLIPRGEDVHEQLKQVIQLAAGDQFRLRKVHDEYALLAYLTDYEVAINDMIDVLKIDEANQIMYLKHTVPFAISFDNARKMFTDS
ncbi:metal-dependent transcriptional regulator [Macrococcus carouselicus]|uniref:Manganese transport regulator n=1 Tax=Macrococcus carouselicus TaxID=69969 RepID=A0A9Q8CL04_9STAP|nr:metal-dependent transcriptional regulator [Macrococcus carouselicus]TDM04106.1 metal-dependent transcriptional regulator [Macrococcus carouselicus]